MDLDQLLTTTPGAQQFPTSAQCYEAHVVELTDRGPLVVIPGFDRLQTWGPCRPADAAVRVGDVVTVTESDQGEYWVVQAGGGERGPQGVPGPPGPAGPAGPAGGALGYWRGRRTTGQSIPANTWTTSHQATLNGCPAGATILLTGMQCFAGGSNASCFTRFSTDPGSSAEASLVYVAALGGGSVTIPFTDLAVTTTANQTIGQEAYATAAISVVQFSTLTVVRLA